MDELQIIDEILNQIYGYNAIFKGDDKELIKKKKREKDEKQEEMINQINLMCIMLEKELRSELGEAFFEVKKGLRTFVIDTIQKEVKNGNNVIGSDGKISLKKFSTQLLAHKNEIIKENSSKMNISEEQNNEKKYFENDDKNKEIISEIKGLFAGNGIELSEEEATKVYDAVNKTNTIQEKYKKYKEMGLDNKEIIEKFKEEYTIEEIANFVTDAGIAIGLDLLKGQNINKEKSQGNSGEKNSNLSDTEKSITPMPEPPPEPTPEPPSMSTPEPPPEPTPEPPPEPTSELPSMSTPNIEPSYIPTESGYPQYNYGGVYWDNSGWLDTPGEDSATIDVTTDYGRDFCEFMNVFVQDADLQRYCAEGGQFKDEAILEKVYSATKSTNDSVPNDYGVKSPLRNITGIFQNYSRNNSAESVRKSYEVSKGRTIERKGRVVITSKKGKTPKDIKPKEEPVTDEEFNPQYEISEDEVSISKNEPLRPKMEEMYVLNAAQPAKQNPIDERSKLESLFPGMSAKYAINQVKGGLSAGVIKSLYGQFGSLKDTEESATTIGSLNVTKEERTEGDKTPTTPSDEEKE